MDILPNLLDMPETNYCAVIYAHTLQLKAIFNAHWFRFDKIVDENCRRTQSWTIYQILVRHALFSKKNNLKKDV